MLTILVLKLLLTHTHSQIQCKILLGNLSWATQQGPDLQVGRTGMDTGAEGEILSLLDLPTAAPDLWQLMTAPDSSAKHVSNGVTLSKPNLSGPSEAAITSDSQVPMLTA